MSASNEQAARYPDVELTDELVRNYLQANDDFLQRHPDMLDYLHISHASGSAVSLVEKQVAVLRERNVDMRHRLNALTANARENDRLYEQTRDLVLSLMDAGSVKAMYKAFIAGMDRDFGVDHACMILFADDKTEDYRTESKAQAQASIGSLIRGQGGVSGTLRAEEMSFLFPECKTAGSAALIPLHSGEQLGLIAVGSGDENRYSGNVGTLFLAHIAEVIVRLLPQAADAAR